MQRGTGAWDSDRTEGLRYAAYWQVATTEAE